MEESKKNFFRETRLRKNLSLNQISKATKIDRKILKKLDKGEFEDLKLKHLVEICRYLELNIFKVIRELYQLDDIEFYTEEIGNIVDRLVWLQMDLIYSELKELAKMAKMRIDDFNVQTVISQRKNLLKLIVINTKLKKGEITISEALREFPVVDHGYLKRRKLD